MNKKILYLTLVVTICVLQQSVSGSGIYWWAVRDAQVKKDNDALAAKYMALRNSPEKLQNLKSPGDLEELNYGFKADDVVAPTSDAARLDQVASIEPVESGYNDAKILASRFESMSKEFDELMRDYREQVAG